MTFSIIMPAYNCDRYVQEAIESVLAQTYTDFELIIVDDGSTDDTCAICKSIADRDSRICVLKANHAGVSAARNLGIRNARGESVLFMDADDTWEKTLLENCLPFWESNLVVFGIRSDFYAEDGTLVRSELETDGTSQVCTFRIADAGVDIFSKYNMASPCNKVYKKEILESYRIMFDTECVYLEDLKFNLDYLTKIESLTVLPQNLYRYRLQADKKQMLKRKFTVPYANTDAVFASVERFLGAWCIPLENASVLVSILLKAYYSELFSCAYLQDTQTHVLFLRQLNQNPNYVRLLKVSKGKFFTLLKLMKTLNLWKMQMALIKRRYW